MGEGDEKEWAFLTGVKVGNDENCGNGNERREDCKEVKRLRSMRSTVMIRG